MKFLVNQLYCTCGFEDLNFGGDCTVIFLCRLWRNHERNQLAIIHQFYYYIKTSGSESRGQEEAACMRVIRPVTNFWSGVVGKSVRRILCPGDTLS